MRVSYHTDYYVPLPPDHPFPMGKFPALHEILLGEGLITDDDVMTPEEAPREMLERVHTPAYLDKLERFALSRAEERRMGLPWTPALLRRSRLAVSGTLHAADASLVDGIAANLAGGTHHAMPDHAHGFCIFHDVAVAIRQLQTESRIRRALIVDLDVHQGNGSATIFADDPCVYTFSIHNERIFPARKPPSHRDVALPDGTGDDDYLDALARHLPEVLGEARPDIVFYLAGADVAAGDRFGRMKLTGAGILGRDRFVLNTMRHAGIPVTLVMAGGYAATPGSTAEIHAIAYREACRLWREERRVPRPAVPRGDSLFG